MEEMTQSECMTLSRCEKRYTMRYVEGLVPLNTHPALSMGVAVHEGLRSASVDEGIKALREMSGPVWLPFEREKQELREGHVAAMVGGALNMWSDWPDMQEVVFRLQLRNPKTGRASRKHVLSGVWDGAWTDGDEVILGEWKTAGILNEDYILRLDIDFQVSAYLVAASRHFGKPVRKVRYRVIKKPTIKQKKTETLDEYLERLHLDYLERQEHYFYETLVTRTDEQLRGWEEQAWEMHKRVLDLKAGRIPLMNTNSCISRGRCPYFDHCIGAVPKTAFRKLEDTHPELRR